MLRRILFLLIIVMCSACGTDLPKGIQSAEGGEFLSQATRAAQRILDERKTATLQVATMIAQRTREMSSERATGTAQALWFRQMEITTNATESALALQQVSARQQATETSQASHVSAIQTAAALTINRSATGTAESAQASQTALALKATARAQELRSSLEQHQATATTEALQLQRTQAQQQALRSEQWVDYFDSLLKFTLVVGFVGLLFIMLFGLTRYLDVVALRHKLMETRAGTVMITNVGRGQYAARLVASSPVLNSGDEFEATEAHVIANQAEELLKVTTFRGETFIAKSDPAADLRERNRKLALRLLRESLKYYTTRGFAGNSLTRIPTYRDLNWSSETWVRAVSSLKPHVVTKSGRGGGTFCSGEYPTLLLLYSAIGERRLVVPSPPQE